MSPRTAAISPFSHPRLPGPAPELFAGFLCPPAPLLPGLGIPSSSAPMPAPVGMSPALGQLPAVALSTLQPPAGVATGVPAAPDANHFRRRPSPVANGVAPTLHELMRTAAVNGFYQNQDQAKPLSANGKQVGVSIKSPFGGGAISIWTQGNLPDPTANLVAKITIAGRDIPAKERILRLIEPWTLPFVPGAGADGGVQPFALPTPAALLAVPGN